jgi:hypothetical protein
MSSLLLALIDPSVTSRSTVIVLFTVHVGGLTPGVKLDVLRLMPEMLPSFAVH